MSTKIPILNGKIFFFSKISLYSDEILRYSFTPCTFSSIWTETQTHWPTSIMCFSLRMIWMRCCTLVRQCFRNCVKWISYAKCFIKCYFNWMVSSLKVTFAFFKSIQICTLSEQGNLRHFCVKFSFHQLTLGDRNYWVVSNSFTNFKISERLRTWIPSHSIDQWRWSSTMSCNW